MFSRSQNMLPAQMGTATAAQQHSACHEDPAQGDWPCICPLWEENERVNSQKGTVFWRHVVLVDNMKRFVAELWLFIGHSLRVS
jgi:hypothetical protein